MSDGLPTGWILTEIGKLCELVNGKAIKKAEWRNKGLPIVRIQNLNNKNALFNYFNTNIDDKFIIDNGQLLFAWSGTPGTSFGAHVWRGKKAVLNQHIYKVVFDEDYIDKTFFRYAINQKLEELINKAQGGVGLRHVTKTKFQKTKISFPPLNEQKRIAKKLEQLLTTVDATKKRLDKVPTILKRFRQSVLAAAVSGELTKDWREKHNLDFKWKDTDISSIVKEIRYGTSKKCIYDDSLIPVLRIPNVKGRFIDLTDMKYAEFSKKEIEKLSLKKGDILIVRSNGSVDLVGKAVEVTKREAGYLFAGYLIRLRFDSKILSPGFLQIILSAPMVRHIIEVNARSTSGVHNINSKELASIKFQKPTILEQEEITQRVEKLMQHADKLEHRLQQSRKIMDKLTASILQKVFTGKLLPQDPNDEPAEKLLEQIQASRIKK